MMVADPVNNQLDPPTAHGRIWFLTQLLSIGTFASARSFFSSLKKERIRKRIYKTRDVARADVFDYIEVFYNRTRRHSHLGGLSPEDFEQAAA